ncbi:MAG: bifunctional diaminohydroxyphosphoribosylaminopyrimidine deaminase/5-amino-6-(5-phosphoribosylamino)uracil reductase RibD [Gammaproteobacteria bacterium]
MSAGSSFSEFDRRAMSRALALAEHGMETTHPNPRVGCVIARGDRMISEGFHERAGGPHAEVVALRALAAGESAEGATVYVTLEPCSHHGRTPPCVDALIDARVGRVVFAIEDPNPEVAGRGAEALERAGMQVESGLMTAEAEELNAGYLMLRRSGRPFVRLKVGMSLDGRTALKNGASKWITGEAARNDVQHWRARSSAVLTGIGTVLADDPALNVRLPGASRQPMRVVLDTNLRMPPTARMFEGDPKPLIFTASSDSARIAALAQRGAQIEHIETTANDSGAGYLRSVLARLAELSVSEVLVEAGPTLAGTFVQYGMVDELLLYMAPRLLGPQARGLFDLPPLDDLQQAQQFGIIEQLMVGDDLRLRLRPA